MHNLFKKVTALLASSVCMLTFVGISSHSDTKVANAATSTNYSYTLQSGDLGKGNKKSGNYESNPAPLLNSVNWSNDNDGGYYGFNNSKGIQIGSGSYPPTYIKLSTSDFSKKIISKVEVTTHGTANFNVTINNTQIGNEVSVSSNKNYVFENKNKQLRGDLSLNWTNNSTKAIYLKSISVWYEDVVATEPQQLTFDHNDGTPATPETTTYTEIPELSSYVLPDKETQYFDGWYYEKENPTTKVKAGDALEAATTVYAKWTDFKTATFHYEDGVTIDKKIEKLKTGDTIDESLVVKPERENHKFKKWTIGLDGPEFTFASSKETNPTKIKDSSIDLYANWVETHKVYYYMDETDVEAKYEITVEHNQKTSVHSDPTGLKENQLFLYWYEKGTDGSKEFDFKNTKIMQDTHLIAKIVEKPTITLKANNEIVTDDTALFINDELVITAETTGEASKVVWTVDNAYNAIAKKEEGNKITISGLKVGTAIITATVTDPLGTTYTDETMVSVNLKEFQKQDINSQYNLGATYTLVDEGPAKMEKVSGLLEGEYLSGNYIIVDETHDYLLNSTVDNEYLTDPFRDPIDCSTQFDDVNFLSQYSFNITHKDSGYVMKTKTGKYFQSSSKEPKLSTTESFNDISFDADGNLLITNGSKHLVCNANSATDPLFRFYSSGYKSLHLYKVTGGLQFSVQEARAKFSFDVTDDFINTNKVTEVGVRVGKDLANIDKWEKVNLTSTKNGSTYTISVKYTNLSDFAKDVYLIPYVVIDGKTYDFNKKTDGSSEYYDISVETIAGLYDGSLENPKDQDFITRLLDLITKNK